MLLHSAQVRRDVIGERRIDEKLLFVSKEKDLLSRDRSRCSCELVADAAHLMNNHTQYERNNQRKTKESLLRTTYQLTKSIQTSTALTKVLPVCKLICFIYSSPCITIYRV